MKLMWKLTKWVILAWFMFLAINIVLIPFNLGFFILGTVQRTAQLTADPHNILKTYEWFFDTHAQYTVRRAQLPEFIAYMDEEPDSSMRRVLRVELSAIRLACSDLAAKYNAESAKRNRAIFKDWQLPDTIDQGACQR